MAETVAPRAPSAPTGQYLAFSLADAVYAVELPRVREILEFSRPTLVPGSPHFLRGVINVRGGVVPVVDLRLKLGVHAAPETKQTCTVIVEVTAGWGEPVRLGLIVDTVNDIVDLAPGDIEAPPPFGTKIRLDFLRGVGKAGGALYLVLEIDRVLSPDEVSQVDAALGEARSEGEGRG